MPNLSTVSREEATIRYCLTIFRDYIKSSDTDTNHILDMTLQSARAEHRIYERFKKKYPLLPDEFDLQKRDEIIDAVMPMFIERAEKEGLRLKKEQMVRDICETNVSNFFSGQGFSFYILQRKEVLWLRIYFSQSADITFIIEYKKIHNPGILEGMLQDAKTVQAIVLKYGDMVRTRI